MATGVTAQGCKLFWSVDSGTTYVEILGVKDVTFPEVSKDRLEISDLASTAKEYIAGLGDSGSASFGLNVDMTDASQKAMLVLESSSAIVGFKVELVETGLSTVTTAVFDGYVEKLTVGAATNGIQEGSLVIQPTVANTYAHTVVAE